MKKLLSVFLAVLMLVGMLPMTAIHTHAATTAKYVKVTENLADWSGRYLIVYETGKKAMNGGLAVSGIDADNNTINVTITDNAIEATSAVTAAEFTIASDGNGSYTIKSSKNGYYIGRTGSSNGMDESATIAHKHTIKYNGSNVVITSSGGPTLQAYQSGTTYRFRYYKTTQKAIALYKLEEATACTHANTTTTTVDATCTEDGSTIVTCNDCKVELSKTTIPASGHKYELSESTYTCANCGDSYDVFYVSFSVPEGVNAVADMEYTAGGIALPTAGTPSEDYTFAGWVAEEVDNSTAVPEIYKAGEKFTANEAITLYALYTYVVEGEGSATTEYVLTDISRIEANDTVVIVATKTGTNAGTYAMTNNNGTGSAPAAYTVTVDGNKLSGTIGENLKWNIGGDSNGYIFYPNGSTSTWLYCTSTNNGVRVGTNTNKTFKLDASGYLMHIGTSRYLGVYNAQDWRCYTTNTGTSNIANQTFGFYVETEGVASTTYYTTVIDSTPVECEHNYESVVTAPDCVNGGYTTYTCSLCNDSYVADRVDALGHTSATDAAKAPTCTETGLSEGSHCSVCNVVIVAQQTVPATGHSYTDGICTGCGKEQPEATSTRYYIAAKRTADGSKLYYMTNVLTTTSTKRYAAEATELTEIPEVIENPEANKIFVLVNDGDGNYTIYAEGLDADANYLGWTSGNSGALVTEDKAKVLDVAFNDDGSVRITFNSRKLTMNNTTGNDYFAWYESEQANVYLIPIVESCKHTNTITTTVNATCTQAGSVTVACDDCGEVISTETIDALGHDYEAVVTDPTCEDDGYTTYTCADCGNSYVSDEVDALGHSYTAVMEQINGVPTVTGTCDCGEVTVARLKLTSANLTLQNNIVVNFKTTNDVAGEGSNTGFDNLYAEFTYGNRTGDNKIVADGVRLSNGQYSVSCSNISPSQIGDEITATLYGTFDGQVYSYEMTYSVAQYCRDTLATAESAELKALMTDLLFYCDAARAYTGYQGVTGIVGSVTGNLVQRTDGESYAEGAIANPVGSDCAAPAAIWKSASLVITDCTAIQFRVDMGDTVLALHMIDVTVAGKDYTNVRIKQDGDTWLIRVEGLSAHQMRDVVKVQLFDGETAISHTVSYSIVTYAYRNMNAAPELVAMMRAMINYGDSAVAYKKTLV